MFTITAFNLVNLHILGKIPHDFLFYMTKSGSGNFLGDFGKTLLQFVCYFVYSLTASYLFTIFVWIVDLLLNFSIKVGNY